MVKTALVLSGGGSHGAFQMGAIRYLYTVEGVKPDIIAGCSVGSVNAIKLAEAGPSQNAKKPHAQVVAELLELWRKRTSDHDLWNWTPAMKARPSMAAVLLKTLRSGPPNIVPGPATLPLFPPFTYNGPPSLGILLQAVTTYLTAKAALTALEVVEAKTFVDEHEQSFMNLDPVYKDLQDNIDPPTVANSGTILRLATVSLESGTLRYMTEKGSLVERDGVTALDLGTHIEPPDCHAQEAEFKKAEEEWKQATADRKAARGPIEKAAADKIVKVALGAMEKARGLLNSCLASGPVVPNTLDVRDGVLASASIPVAFPPVLLAGEHYVDGGVRELLPLHVTARLGAETIYAVPCSALVRPYAPLTFPDPKEPWLDAAAIGIRTASLIYDEVGYDEQVIDAELLRTGGARTPSYVPLPKATTPAGGLPYPALVQLQGNYKVVMIDPWTDFYDITQIIPELVEVVMAYGWMRAYEECNGVAKAACDSDDIARYLYAIYIYGLPAAGYPQAKLDDARAEVQAMVAKRTAAFGPNSVPPESAGW